MPIRTTAILLLLATLRTRQAPPRLAVLDFSNGTPIDAARVEPLRRALGSTLAGAIALSGRATVIERNRLAALLAEQDLARTARIEDGSAARIGKLLGVDYLLLGSYIVQPNGDMLVSTRLVNVATSMVSAGPEATGSIRTATKVINGLAAAVAQRLALPAPSRAADGRGGVHEAARNEKGNSNRASEKDSPELSATIDALARACDVHDVAAATAARAAVVRRAPQHPALAAPCF